MSRTNRPIGGPDRRDGCGQDAAVAAGDADAFASVHDRFDPGLRRLFARRVRGRAEVVDDLAQQTWSHAWQAICQKKYDPARAAISTFVYAIAKNVWLQFCRRQGRHVNAEVELPVDDAQPVERILAHAELLEALRDCLLTASDTLSTGEREIAIGLARGLSERDLARELSCAPSTLHARKQAAYAKLRRCLAEKGFPAETIEQLDLSME
jgi:RNA polymerase sigma-70 factor (ECF subfamily)